MCDFELDELAADHAMDEAKDRRVQRDISLSLGHVECKMCGHFHDHKFELFCSERCRDEWVREDRLERLAFEAERDARDAAVR